MTTRTDVDFNIVTIAVTVDNMVINGSGSIINGNRYSVTAMSMYNNTGGDILVRFFRSFDDTSANGIEFARYTLRQDASTDIYEIIGQGFDPNSNIIAVADGAGAVIKSSGTIYEEDN